MLLFEEPVLSGKLIARRKRFFMDVRLPSGEEITAHTANTGSMKGLLEVGNEVLLTKSNNPKRTTAYSVQGIKVRDSWVGVNTMLPNRLIKASLNHETLSFLSHYSDIKSEVKYGINGRSRIDFLLSNSTHRAPCYLEIKNVTLKVGVEAQFPDALSIRAQKHIDDLMLVIKEGFSAALIFVVQRQDCDSFRPANHIDRVYGEKLSYAVENGLIVKALAAKIDREGLQLTHEIRCHF